MNNNDRYEFVINDEGFYLYQKRSGLSMTAFIKKHRTDIDNVILSIMSGKKHSHFLVYG